MQLLITDMKKFSPFKYLLPFIIAASAVRASAQIATVDASNPTNIVILYDGGPYLYAPNTPDEPTTIYTNDILIPSTSSSTLTIEYDALIDAGIIEGTAGNLDGQYTAQEPVVTTSEPDTYTTNATTVYYTAPTNDPPLVATANSGPFYFDFGTVSSPVASGYLQVTPMTAYDPSVGYGWGDTNRVSSRDRGGSDLLERDFCLPNGTPFYLDLSNGTYMVSVLSGDATQKSGMAVRGNGMLELYNMAAPTGNYLQQSFPIKITTGRLRLEFFGSICHVNAITVTRLPDDQPHKTTIFVASDSTAAAYTQYQYPLTGWGDRLANYLTPDVAVDDEARAGRSLRSFIDEGSLDCIMNRIQTNDYLFIMSAINDAAKDNRYANATTTYKAYLRLYVNAARSHGAIPVFVTSQTKRTYDLWGRFYNSVGAYPQSMREMGAELNVPVIDLNQKSIDYFTSVGPDATTNFYMFLPPNVWTNWPNGDADYIHFQDRGATVLGRLVVNGIQELNLPGLAQYVIGPPFIAAQPTSQTVMVGSNATFVVDATGTPPMSYQWLLNGTVIAGATNSSLTIANAQLANAGDYSVIVANATGQTLTSATATLTVDVNAIFSGRAMAGSVNVLGTSTNVSDTGNLSGSGGAIESSVFSTNALGALAVNVGHASTVGQADRTRSEASAADIALNLGGVSVSADFVLSRATAIWQSNGTTALLGDTEVDGLLINGQPITISGQPNQTIPLLNGEVVINEQNTSATSITVNALHIIINGVADVVVASAQAGMASLTIPVCSGGDYITGGGWITGTASGGKGTFGLSAGTSNNIPWGDLTYKDHGDGLTVKSTTITTYAPGATPNSRHIEGIAQINGVDGYTFSVDVTDNGDPGTNDTFGISLSDGYQAGGSLGGGNIQLNDPCQ
jgi:lysophospholipase L1-like esterase